MIFSVYDFSFFLWFSHFVARLASSFRASAFGCGLFCEFDVFVANEHDKCCGLFCHGNFSAKNSTEDIDKLSLRSSYFGTNTEAHELGRVCFFIRSRNPLVHPKRVSQGRLSFGQRKTLSIIKPIVPHVLFFFLFPFFERRSPPTFCNSLFLSPDERVSSAE
jgi:hypothetical protein